MDNTVLVVDDDEINRMVAQLFLQKLGWRVAQAASADEALRQVDTQWFDRFLLDISMPGICGIELCRRLRADPRSRHSRLIAYTAHAVNEEKAAIAEAGFDAIVTKPITRDSLILAVGLPDPSPPHA